MDLFLRRNKVWILKVVAMGAGVLLLGLALNNGFASQRLVPAGALAAISTAPARRTLPTPQVVTEPVVTPVVTPLAAVEPIAAEPIAAAHEPIAPEPIATPAPVVTGPPPFTNLPLSLVATSVVKPSHLSSAIIADGTTRSSAYWAGDSLPGAGPIVFIAPRYVDFVNRNGQTERLDLVASRDRPVPENRISDVPAVSAAPKDELTAELDASVKQTDATHFTLDRKFVDKVLANPMMLAATLRARPVAATDKVPGGLRLSGVKPGSAAAKLGLQNGDTITSINGNDTGGASPDKLLEMYSKMKSASSLSIQVSRRGAPVTLDYLIK